MKRKIKHISIWGAFILLVLSALLKLLIPCFVTKGLLLISAFIIAGIFLLVMINDIIEILRSR